MNSLDFAVKRVLDSTIVTKGSKELAGKTIKKQILKLLDEFELKKIPDFFVDLLVLEKIKEVFEEEKESKLVLQRNLTLKERKFLSDEGIKVFFGDFESFDEEFLLSDFEDKLYLLDYDKEKSFIYAHAVMFRVEERYENNFVS